MKLEYDDPDVLIHYIDLLIEHCFILDRWEEIRYILEEPWKYEDDFREAIELEQAFQKELTKKVK